MRRRWRDEVGPPAIAAEPLSRSGQKIRILGLKAGSQSGQKVVKMGKQPDLVSGQIGGGFKNPNLVSGQNNHS
jgi:hypothetical protein